MDWIHSKIIKKHNINQNDKKTLIYKNFYKIAFSIYKTNEVINWYKENYNPIILNLKVNIMNNIIKAFYSNKVIILIVLVIYLVPF